MSGMFEYMSRQGGGGDANAAGAQQRRCGRVICQETMCSLGQILDLSATGARVQCSGKPGVEPGMNIAVQVQTLDGPVDVGARVVWVRKAGWRKHLIGLQFVQVSDGARAALARLARSAAWNETIRDDVARFRQAG